MAGADRGLGPRRLCSATGAALTLFTLASCASDKPAATALPPVTEIQKPTEEPRAAETPVATPKPPSFVVIDEGGAPQQAPQSLAEAARNEKSRRSHAAKPVAVLDNASLAAHGKNQKLTIAEGAPPAVDGEGVGGSEKEPMRDEAYWRDRGLEIRQRWRAAFDRVVELQAEAEELRRRFYAADDPYVRDGQIKPDWDRALDALSTSRQETSDVEEELERFLDDGRMAGAVPGWLREGAELEPEAAKRSSSTAEPGEPVEATEPNADPE